MTAPHVVRGKVQRQNRTACSDPLRSARDVLLLERNKPGRGFRQVLTLRDLKLFLSLLPDWDELAHGLRAIVLAPGRPSCDGWHRPGVVAVCAWEKGLWRQEEAGYYREHRDIFERLGVPCDQVGDGYLCRFTEATVRAYQLLHILLHELGHHHDRMTTRSQRQSSRGEGFAELYARCHERLLWDAYLKFFSLDSRRVRRA